MYLRFESYRCAAPPNLILLEIAYWMCHLKCRLASVLKCVLALISLNYFFLATEDGYCIDFQQKPVISLLEQKKIREAGVQ